MLAEERTLLEDYEPALQRADVVRREVPVHDGMLDIEFVQTLRFPKISAIEIERME